MAGRHTDYEPAGTEGATAFIERHHLFFLVSGVLWFLAMMLPGVVLGILVQSLVPGDVCP